MPESIVVLRRILAVAGLFTVAAQPLPEEFGGVFWGSVLTLELARPAGARR